MHEEISENKYQIIEGESCLLELRKLAEKVYGISKLADFDDEDIRRSVSERLEHFCLTENIEILSNENPQSEPTNKFLETNGFSITRKKAFFQKDLRDYIFSYSDKFAYRSLADVGLDFFLEVLDVVTINDDERTGSAKEFLQELIDMAGESYNNQNWFIAFELDSPIGLLLPQAFDDDTYEGSIFYIGILPQYRNQGLGKILHAKGLSKLKLLGCNNYVGSTDVSNQSMLKVFDHNHCEQTSTQLFYKLA